MTKQRIESLREALRLQSLATDKLKEIGLSDELVDASNDLCFMIINRLADEMSDAI